MVESLTSGTMAGAGSFRCQRCGYVLTLAASDTLSDCPGCGGASFVRASLFSVGRLAQSGAPDLARRRQPTRPRAQSEDAASGWRRSGSRSSSRVSISPTRRTARPLWWR